MVKRSFTLLKDFFSDLLSKTEVKYEKNRDPVAMLQTGLKKIEAQKNIIKGQYMKCETDLLRNKKIIDEKKDEREVYMKNAKDFKKNKDADSANHALRMVVRIDEWVERNNSIVEKLSARQAELKNTLSDLIHKHQEYKLDLSLIESSHALANGKLAEYEEFGVDLSSLDDLLKEANDKVDEKNFEIKAHESVHEITGKAEAKRKTDNSNDLKVKELYDKL